MVEKRRRTAGRLEIPRCHRPCSRQEHSISRFYLYLHHTTENRHFCNHTDWLVMSFGQAAVR